MATTFTQLVSALRTQYESKGQHRLARLLLSLAASSPKRGVAFGYARNSGITTGKINGYFTCPYAGTITGWTIQIASTDSGTITIRFWKRASGTSVPTVSDNINTSGVSLTSGTLVESTVTSDFTTTAVAAGDVFAVEITAITGSIKDFSGTLQIQPT